MSPTNRIFTGRVYMGARFSGVYDPYESWLCYEMRRKGSVMRYGGSNINRNALDSGHD
jgi:hypothetical protein